MDVFQEHPAIALTLLALPFAATFAWRRRGAPRGLLLGATLAFELGLVGAAMILVHIGFIASELRDLETFEYDFHYYAMWLFGILNLALTVGTVRVARGWANGEREALARALRLSLLALVLNAPVGPLQEFAWLFTAGAAAIALVAFATARVESR